MKKKKKTKNNNKKETTCNEKDLQEMQFRPLGWKGPLEKEMATYSSIFAWKSPWTKEPGGLQPVGVQRVGHN